MTKSPRDQEFHEALTRLLRDYYDGNSKALAHDLGVDRSTLNRWLNDQTVPTKKVREAVLDLLRKREEEEAAALKTKIKFTLEANCGELLKRLIGRQPPSEDPPREAPPEFVEDLKELYRRIIRERKSGWALMWHVVLRILKTVGPQVCPGLGWLPTGAGSNKE